VRGVGRRLRENGLHGGGAAEGQVPQLLVVDAHVGQQQLVLRGGPKALLEADEVCGLLLELSFAAAAAAAALGAAASGCRSDEITPLHRPWSFQGCSLTSVGALPQVNLPDQSIV